jgi:hypothetical protein
MDQSTYKALLNLVETANNLNSIVEGIPSVRWSHGGKRFKDTEEWAAFYCALAAVNDDTARRAIQTGQVLLTNED